MTAAGKDLTRQRKAGSGLRTSNTEANLAKRLCKFGMLTAVRAPNAARGLAGSKSPLEWPKLHSDSCNIQPISDSNEAWRMRATCCLAAHFQRTRQGVHRDHGHHHQIDRQWQGRRLED